MDERQNNYTIAEGFELPSGGKIYDVPVNAHVELRSMTARDEMKRLSPSSTPLKTLCDIIEGCMIEKPAVHVYDMAFGDYEFLLQKLRIVTYGPKFKVNIKCSHCGDFIEEDADLDSLDIHTYNEDAYVEASTITLPVCGKTIVLKPQSPRIIEQIEAKAKEMKRRYKNAELDFEVLNKILCNIASVDGEVLKAQALEDFVMNLKALDMQKILNGIDKLSALIGMDNKLWLTCPDCGGEVLTFFRYGPEFFRPTNIQRWFSVRAKALRRIS